MELSPDVPNADRALRLLREEPAAIGLAVPGMPAGAPGMEGGAPATYEVILFGNLKAQPKPYCNPLFLAFGGYCAPFL